MRQLITWTIDGPSSVRHVARLGTVVVGAVDTLTNNAQWICHLPNGFALIPAWHDARSEEAARSALTAVVLGWLRDAGIIDLAERDQASAAELPLFADPA